METIKHAIWKNKMNLIVGLMIVLYLIFLLILNRSVKKTALLPDDGSSFVQATVVEVLQDFVKQDGIESGTQLLRAEIHSGDYQGQVIEATNISSYLYGAMGCDIGSDVILHLSEDTNTVTGSVYQYDRGNTIYVFAGLFMLILLLIGKKKGVSALVSLIFTFINIIFLYLPLIYLGFSPFFCAVLAAILTTMVTMYLIGGCSNKTLCSILGTVAGVIIAGLIAYAFGSMGHISGYNVEDIETLVFVGQNSHIQIGGLLFSGILISALGAVMDVAMSISTTIEEIHYHNPELSRRELYKSGIKVGSDMMGTMSNTLILAFTGGSLSLLVIDYAYDMSLLQILNSYTVSIEIMQGIAGTLGVILTVPFVSLICCYFMTRRHKNG